jgi:hypothetical protein
MSEPRTPTTDLGRLAQGTPLTRSPPPAVDLGRLAPAASDDGMLPPFPQGELLEIQPEFAPLTEAGSRGRAVLIVPHHVVAIFGPVDNATEIVLQGGRSILVVEPLDEVVAALGAVIRNPGGGRL